VVFTSAVYRGRDTRAVDGEEDTMTTIETFELIAAEPGRWDIRLHDSVTAMGTIWRSDDGFVLYDWLDRGLGTFRSADDAAQSFLGGARSLSRPARLTDPEQIVHTQL
jgi:hypothetical protein